jgi:uncharacterized LabA/DUF88 family protein
MATNVYVDGFNLYYGCLRGTEYKWLDLAALCRVMLPNDDIHRIRYFTARVSGRPPDNRQPQRQDTYFRALRTIPGLSIHLGHFLTHAVRMPLAAPRPGGPTTALVQKTEEKGSDVNLATYLLLDAFTKDCDSAVVISNDSDLKEPVALAQSELGMPVGVLNPHPANRRSRAMAPTFFKQIREPALRASQFPAELADAQGAFRRPAGW